MKTKYIKPITEIISLSEQKYIMMSNSEIEVTENMGAKENNFDWDDDDIEDTWSNE